MNIFNFLKEKERSNHCCIFEFYADRSLPYFDGHFENFELLPALAQVKIVTDISSYFFKVNIESIQIPSVKFIKPIFPDTKVMIEIEYSNNNEKIEFKFFKFVDNSIYSKGTLVNEKL